MPEKSAPLVLPAIGLSRLVGGNVRLPPLVHLRRQERGRPAVEPAAATRRVMEAALHSVGPGERVAILVGSRGIAGVVDVVRSCVASMRERGALPFVVPAMGSHGGATARGQREVLTSLGVTEANVGAPIVASMETLHLGSVDAGEGAIMDVYVDAEAARADHLLAVNRIKSHTSFSGRVESGIAKMLAIGLGKQRGAQELHRLGPAHLERRIAAAVRVITTELPILGGLAVVEDRSKRIHSVTFVLPTEIGRDGERALLGVAKTQEARLPFSCIDVLIVDLMGKEISGTGMDTNVLGRRMVRGMPEPDGIQITNVVVLDISSSSGGNAMGIGLADFVPERTIARIDLAVTYANALTAGLQGVQRVQLPIVLASDRDAIHAAVLTAGLPDTLDARIVRIQNTLLLDDLWATPNLVSDGCEGYSILGDLEGAPMSFADDGRLVIEKERI